MVAGNCYHLDPHAEVIRYGRGLFNAIKTLPHALLTPASVQLEDTFLVIGGRDPGYLVDDSIYYLGHDHQGDYDWKVLNVKLDQAGFSYAAFFIPDYLTSC